MHLPLFTNRYWMVLDNIVLVLEQAARAAAAVLLHHGGQRQHLVNGLELHEDALAHRSSIEKRPLRLIHGLFWLKNARTYRFWTLLHGFELRKSRSRLRRCISAAPHHESRRPPRYSACSSPHPALEALIAPRSRSFRCSFDLFCMSF